jgi:hypothetical protein
MINERDASPSQIEEISLAYKTSSGQQGEI